MKNSIHNIAVHSYFAGKIADYNYNEYIDFTSGIFAASLGMYNAYISTAIGIQANHCMHAYQFGTEAREDYLAALCRFTGFESAYMFSSGTEAVEAAWKIARRAKHKDGIIGLQGAFHGKTMGAQIAAGRKNDWRNQTPGNKTAALIFEPYNAPTCQFLSQPNVDRINELVKEFDLILIADEVQAGFYRTGKLFGFQHYHELKPDLVCIGKAMTNGFPASAVLGPSKLIDDPVMDLSSTNGGNPLACAAGLEVIRQMEDRKFLSNLEKLSDIFQKGLKKLRRPAQGRGMIGSIHFDSTDDADECVLKCRDSGLLVVHTKTQTVKIGPPLNIPADVLEDGLKILFECV